MADEDGGAAEAVRTKTGGVDGDSPGPRGDGGAAPPAHERSDADDRPPEGGVGERPGAEDIPSEADAAGEVARYDGASAASEAGRPTSNNASRGATDGEGPGGDAENRPSNGDVKKAGVAVVDASMETGAKNAVARDNVASAVTKSEPSAKPTRPSVTDKTADGTPPPPATGDGDAIRATSPPRLNAKAADVRPRNEPPSSPIKLQDRPIPQSRRPASEAEGDEFGPFVDPAVESEWNPFGEGGVASGEMFSVDDDLLGEPEQRTNSEPYVRKRSTGTTTHQTPEAELDGLRRVFDSEYERAVEDQEISWRARYGATRCSFLASALLMVLYLWLGCMFYRSEAGWSVPDALLFTVYTVTTVGYGGPQPLPNTAAFHAFTSVYVVVGISLVTVLGAHTYQMVTLEATRIRTSTPFGRRGGGQSKNEQGNDFGQEALDRYKQQFMSELEDLARDQPFVDAVMVKFKEFQNWRRTTKAGRVLSLVGPFLGNILLGAVVVGTIEEWSPLESIYWSIVTLTTVGYGDYVPTQDSSVWFCTLFFIPSSLFFLSFLLASVAKTYIRHHAIQVTRLERNMRRKNERLRKDAERAEKGKRNLEATAAGSSDSSLGDRLTPPASPSGSTGKDEESGFTTVISYAEDEHLDNSPTKTSGLFGDEAGNLDDVHGNDPLSPESSPALRYRANVIRNKDTAPDPRGNRAVSFAEALRSLNQPSRSLNPGRSDPADDFENEDQAANRPSLEVRLRVQARLARIIAEEVAGYQTGVIIKGSTVSLTVGSLRDTADKWRIPPQAWKAFRAVSFRSLLFVGERDLISDGGDALLRLNVMEFHQIFSPMLAAMGDGASMEAWLAATNVLADVELRGGARYGQGKPIFNGTFT